MTVIPVISAKGGVGKTTMTANLAVALAQAGRRVMAIDLDPQNALVFHLALEQQAPLGGLSDAVIGHAPWQHCVRAGHAGVMLLPFGNMDDDQQTKFELTLAHEPLWLHDMLHSFALPHDAILLVDTPPGTTVYLQQVLRIASLAVVTVLADAASFATLHTAERMLDKFARSRSTFYGASYVINQVNARRRLDRDVLHRLRGTLGPDLVGVIHEAPAVGEALASELPLNHYAPDSQAAHDLAACARQLLQLIDHALVMAPDELVH